MPHIYDLNGVNGALSTKSIPELPFPLNIVGPSYIIFTCLFNISDIDPFKELWGIFVRIVRVRFILYET